MAALASFVEQINGIVWGVPMLILILGTGLYLMLGLRFMPLRNIGYGFRLTWQGRTMAAEDQGEISPFAALMTALAATVGTGNIAGIATAIALGGPVHSSGCGARRSLAWRPSTPRFCSPCTTARSTQKASTLAARCMPSRTA